MILSIGHSNHDLDRLLSLLSDHQVEVIGDVRSTPRSGYSPHFDREPLTAALRDASIGYVFLGDSLGGRPPEAELYDAEGHVRYDLLAEVPRFREGLERLCDGARDRRVAMLCSEEDPTHCHRRLLIARVLSDEGVEVAHIRGDGRVETEGDLEPMPEHKIISDLFGEERSTWRSTRSVSPSAPRPSSSER